MHHSSMLWEISLLYFFSWNFIWFLQKEPTTVQNFRLLTAQVKFHQICTLIGYFCWKYIKFQLKKVWRKYVSWYQRVVQNLKKNLFFVSKMTRIWWISIQTLKSLICTLIGPFCAKYTTFDLKNTEELYFVTLKNHAKFEEKLICGLDIDMRNLANFHQNSWECQNCFFHGILLS